MSLKKLINFFAGNNNNRSENKDKEDLTQPRKNDSSDKKRVNWRKILIYFFIIAAIVTVIGLIIYFSTRRGYEEILVKRAHTELVGNKRELKLERNDPEGKNIAFTFTEQALINAEVQRRSDTKYLVIANVKDFGAKYAFYVIRSDADKWYIGETLIRETHLDPNNPKNELQNDDFGWFIHLVTQKAEYPRAGVSPQTYISPIISIILFIFFMWFIMRANRAQSESLLGIGKGDAKLTKSKVRFTDVAGIAEVKEELIEIVDFLKQPKKYVAAGARIPKGVMLYGPPGTGKTLIAKAVAGEANVPFFQTTGSTFEDTFVGVGARRVRELFEKARRSAPAIVFIDEIDSVAKKRGNSLNAVQDQTINQLLAELDGFETSSGVIVIAATNRLDTLDDAILRPGRFDRHISVNLPDILEREQILKIHSRNKNISSKVKLADIARRTAGFSGAQLENALNEAALLSVRENSPSITLHHLDEAIDRVIGGPSRKNKVIDDREREQIAYHEAGHALIGLYLPGVDVVQKITIVARGQAAGYTLQTPEKQENTLQRKTDLIARIRVALGGRAAEELIYGIDNITTGAANDFYKVTKIARAMVASFGMTKLGLTQHIPTEGVDNPYRNNYSNELGYEIDKEVELLIQEQYKLAKEMILEHRDELNLIVETLLELETIIKPQIDYIHEHKKLPPEVIEHREKMKEAKETEDSKE
ncbi:ATP-dependent zinc metalloprotease FtsH [Ureaplasma canigenitalium]|uniref:ATP-dependent zinc metalloprotease FtsH n=1 Tax=Ureaplasma canigenitalium TaxID=42092 RepID=UPI00068EF120|nr:ATP-dependent zinc metalloprotease FtsH [Ureaplasma canigenitalium]